MKKLLLLTILLSIIIIYNDSNRKLVINLWGNMGGVPGCILGGEIGPLKSLSSKGFTGNFLLRHFFYNQDGENIRVRFHLKEGEKIIIHLPIFPSNVRDKSYKNLIIKGREL